MDEAVSILERPQGTNRLDEAASRIPDERRTAEPRHVAPLHPKLAAVHGERVVGGVIQTCSLEDTVAINQVIATTVLVDEHTHVPKLTAAPYPKHSVTGNENKSLANNDAWLLAIRDGHWPIPSSYAYGFYVDNAHVEVVGRALGHDPHDFAEDHIFFMELAPREMQDEISEAAAHGLAVRLEALDDPSLLEHGLLLPGERADEPDPLAHSWRGTRARDDINAISVIDEISDDSHFPELMEKLLELGSPEERTAYIQHYAGLAALSEPQINAMLRQLAPKGMAELELTDWIQDERRQIGAVRANMNMMVGIANFNMRHREKRNMTAAEQQQAQQAYLAGLVRVANKLAGLTVSG